MIKGDYALKKNILAGINIFLLWTFLFQPASFLITLDKFRKTLPFPVVKSPITLSTRRTITPNPIKKVYVSPNHQWQLSYVDDEYPITITSLIDNKTSQDLDTPYPIRQLDAVDWFPDSSGFILWARDYVSKLGPSNRLIIYQIHKNGSFQRRISTKLDREYGYFLNGIYWSPDTSEFAVAESGSRILVYNRNGVITHAYPIQYTGPDAYFRLFGWTRQGILYMNGEDASRRPKAVKLFIVDPKRTNMVPTIFYTFENNRDIITLDPSSTYLLIHRYAESGNDKKYELAIFNINSKQCEKVIPTNIDYIYDFKANSDSSVLAIQEEDFGKDPRDNLFLFYWKTQTLVDQHMIIENLYKGWDETLNAFRVDKWDSSIRDWTATLIRP